MRDTIFFKSLKMKFLFAAMGFCGITFIIITGKGGEPQPYQHKSADNATGCLPKTKISKKNWGQGVCGRKANENTARRMAPFRPTVKSVYIAYHECMRL